MVWLSCTAATSEVVPAATGHIAHSVDDPDTVDLHLHSRWMKIRPKVPPCIVSKALVFIDRPGVRGT